MKLLRSHPSDEELLLLLGDEKRAPTAGHVAKCGPCQRELALLGALRRGVASLPPAGPCSEAEAIAAFALGTTQDREDTALRTHLLGCSACTLELHRCRVAMAVEGRAKGSVEFGPRGDRTRQGRLARLFAKFFIVPVYQQVTPRGAKASPRSPKFEKAMRFYVAGARGAALVELGRKPGKEEGAAAAFYRGVCLLEAGSSKAAVDSLARAVELEGGLSRYRWYYGLAFLRAGRVPEGEVEFRKLAASRGRYREQARLLLAQMGPARER